MIGYEFIEDENKDVKNDIILEESEEELFTVKEVDEEDESITATEEIYEEFEYLEPETIEEVQILVDAVEQVDKFEFSNKFFCQLCESNAKFNHEILLERHQWEVHNIGSDPFVCSICNFVFDIEDVRQERAILQIEKHRNEHEIGKMNSCSICPEVFTTQKKMEKHQQTCHLRSSANKCKSCKNNFLTTLDLQVHLNSSECRDVHERPFHCYICGDNFVMGISKKKHIQMMHQDKKGADCPLCMRSKIPSAIAFENHFKIHFESEIFLLLNHERI